MFRLLAMGKVFVFSGEQESEGVVMRKEQRGFTLIELVVVITILGLLAAFAIPRSASFQADARMAKMNAALGSLKSAAALAHSVQVSQQLAPAASITMEGSTITMANGYPTAALDAIGHASGFNESNGAVIQGYVTATAGTTFTITPDAGHPACTVTYTEAAAPGASPAYSSAGVTLANCQ
jgi:MSHA pilin protein MshA